MRLRTRLPDWRPASLALMLPALPLLLLAGCEEPRHVGGTKPAANSAPAEPPAAGPEAAPVPAPEPVQPREILGKKTMDIRNAETELQKGGQVASTRIVAKDPITLPGNAYVSIVGRNSISNIKHALDLWQAENGRFPKDYQEFKDEIIVKNNIALPQLPYYQEYGYDPQQHSLVILEYPDRKAQVQKQDDARYGR